VIVARKTFPTAHCVFDVCNISLVESIPVFRSEVVIILVDLLLLFFITVVTAVIRSSAFSVIG
jgi:hypothetical protein